MKPRLALTQLRPLLKRPHFSSVEAARLGVSAATLAYYVKKGDLVRISRGVYSAPNAPEIQDFRWEDLALATKKVNGGVVCLTSALAIYGLTEELTRQHWIAISNQTSHKADRLVRVVRMRNMSLGRTEVDLGGVKIPIFDRERTIVDAFRYLGAETAIKALRAGLMNRKSSDRIDTEKLMRYARQLRVKILPYLMAVTT